MANAATLVVMIVAFSLPTPAHANVGRSRFPGTRTAEPMGLRDVAIEREELSFDLRALASGGEASVSASYHLDNRSAGTVTAPLVFVAGASIASGIVSFDGVKVAGEGLNQDQLAALPPSWSAPITTPPIRGERALDYETEINSAIAFTLAIPPGRHELTVTYAAIPQRTKGESAGPTLLHQLGYVLAPARDWGSFGTLEVSVEVPPGWRVATAPALTRSGDTLRGRFPSLPADTIGITLQAATSTLHDVLQIVLPVLALLVLIGGGFALFTLGRARGGPERLRALWPVSLPASLVWAIAIGVSGGSAALRSEIEIPQGQSSAHGYAGGFGVVLAMLVALIAIPGGLALARVGSSRKS
jgi:hypothetical protein